MAATNRTQAMVLGVEILQQFVRHFHEHWCVDVALVCGNEGRINEELGFNHFVASDNYDNAIPLMLKHIFSGNKDIRFHIPDNPMEKIVSVNGVNILLLHGHGGMRGGPSEAAAKIRAKYSERGISIGYVMWGHIHEAHVSELFARSGSPAGGNAYSNNALSLMGRASQNFYVFYEDGTRHGGFNDLQTFAGYEGYNIDESLVAYNTKSANKTKKHDVILTITV